MFMKYLELPTMAAAVFAAIFMLEHSDASTTIKIAMGLITFLFLWAMSSGIYWLLNRFALSKKYQLRTSDIAFAPLTSGCLILMAMPASCFEQLTEAQANEDARHY
jgi:hypothetical protein